MYVRILFSNTKLNCIFLQGHFQFRFANFFPLPYHLCNVRDNAIPLGATLLLLKQQNLSLRPKYFLNLDLFSTFCLYINVFQIFLGKTFVKVFKHTSYAQNSKLNLLHKLNTNCYPYHVINVSLGFNPLSLYT